MTIEGWVKIHRALIESRLWLAEPFTRGQAWVDLILLANHKDGYIRIRGVRVDVLRGQVGWSERTLAKRWKWSRGKVRRWLKELWQIEAKIEPQKSNISSVITLINYNKYQMNNTTDSTTDGPQTGHRQYQNKNNKNVKKKDKIAFTLPEWIPETPWNGFIEMRCEIKKPLTGRAIELAITRLAELKKAGNDPGAVLDQSTYAKWQGLFEIKTGGNNGRPTKPLERNRIPEYKGTETPCESPTERERGKQVLQQIRLSIEKGEAKI